MYSFIIIIWDEATLKNILAEEVWLTSRTPSRIFSVIALTKC